MKSNEKHDKMNWEIEKIWWLNCPIEIDVVFIKVDPVIMWFSTWTWELLSESSFLSTLVEMSSNLVIWWFL